MAKTLAEATKKPNNIGDPVPAPAQPQIAPPPVATTVPRELPGLGRATLGPTPSVWTTQYDSVKQFYRPGTSQQRFPPLPTKSNPQINAQAASVTKTIIENTKTTVGGGGGTTFVPSMPVNEQSVTAYVVKKADLANLDTFSNNAGGTIVLPGASIPGGSFFSSTSTNGHSSSAGSAGNAFFAGAVIAIQTAESDLGSPNLTPTGGGWVAIDATQNGAYASVYAKLIPSGAFTASYSMGTTLSWSNLLLFFANCNVVPTVVQSMNIASGGISGTETFSKTFTLPVTPGNSILVIQTLTSIPYDAVHSNWAFTSFSASDGVNAYGEIGSSSGGIAPPPPPGTGLQSSAALASNVVGGSTTVTVDSVTPVGHASGGYSATAYEINLGTARPIPSGFPAGWYCYLENTGSGTFSITSPAFIDGLSTPVSMGPNTGTIVAFDGTNWFTERGLGGGTPVTFPISIVDGGTGTSTPNLVAGSGISITGAWPDQTITVSGSGVVTAGTPIMTPPPRTTSDNSFGNQTLVFKLAQEMILAYPTKFKVSFLLQSGAVWVMTAGVVLRTAYTNTSSLAGIGALAVIDSTPISWGGSFTPTLGSGENVSDAINLTLDTTHDYWIVCHFSSTSGVIYINNASAMVQNPSVGALYYGYVSGDHTGATTMPPTLTTTAGYPVEVLLWRIIAG